MSSHHKMYKWKTSSLERKFNTITTDLDEMDKEELYEKIKTEYIYDVTPIVTVERKYKMMISTCENILKQINKIKSYQRDIDMWNEKHTYYTNAKEILIKRRKMLLEYPEYTLQSYTYYQMHRALGF
jgi:hypothetical protein